MSDYRTTLLAENEKLRAEVERLRAEANARAVEELREVLKKCDNPYVSWDGLGDYCKARIAELSKPAAKESEPSPQEKQRRGFAFGNTSIENPRITPEMVDAEAEKLAKESDPAKDDTAKCWSCGGQGYIGTTSGIPGMIGYAHNSCSRCGGTGKLHYVAMEQLKDGEPEKPVTGPNYLDQEEFGHTKSFTVPLKKLAHDDGGSKPEEPDWTVTLAAQANVASVRADKARLLTLIVEGLCNLGREVRKAVRK